MAYLNILLKHLLLILLLAATCNADATKETFLKCMSLNVTTTQTNTEQYLHTSDIPSYPSLLQSFQQNPRWLNSARLKPLVIVTPYTVSQIQAVIVCSRQHGLRVRTLSGGHDYEGQSYLSRTPFVIINLINIRSVEVDIEKETAWVQAGATLGEVYYNIAKKSGVHGFSGGICPSVGTGGHISGGGYGKMGRKHGLAADNIIDAHLIDVNGRILDRKAMGEDLFWAIRGGGGSSFGVIVSWKLKLVRVPPLVTVFDVRRRLDQEATKLVDRWQYVANKLPGDVYLRVVVDNVDGKNKIKVAFEGLYLGGVNELIPLMSKSFPELGLKAESCNQMTWIESVLYFAGYPKTQSRDVLLARVDQYKSNFKAKSDFVTKPIPASGLEGIWERFLEEPDLQYAFVIMEPFGGRMNEIPDTQLPFPHRNGNLYELQYMVKWEERNAMTSEKHVEWIRRLYKYMEQHVSNSPRAAYLNYRDLDLGTNKEVNTSYTDALAWGNMYFKGNFRRLAQVKSKVDPENFFRDEQSIPPLVHTK